MERKTYCDICDKAVGFTTFDKLRKGKIKDTVFEYVETYCQCKECGNYVEYPPITNLNLRRYYDAYKRQVGLLTSEEIIAIRKKHDLSAERFAKLLGLGAKTITRYENGAIQSKEADNLIRLADHDVNLFLLAEIAGISLKPKPVHQRFSFSRQPFSVEIEIKAVDRADYSAFLPASESQFVPGVRPMDLDKNRGEVTRKCLRAPAC